MQKRVFIVHGWEGYPEEGWFPWLKAELVKRGFLVMVPAMPEPAAPTIEKWVGKLSEVVGTPDEQTYFVGHSMGVITILKYLETLPESARVGGLVSVAGFLEKPINISDEDDTIVAPWFLKKISDKVRIIVGKVSAIFSPTDKWVRIENKKLFEDQLGAQTFIEDGKGEKGHFSGSDGVTELSKALELVLKLAETPTISIDEFFKSEIKMGRILTAERIPGADKLLKLSVDLGAGEVRTICSGVAQFYEPEELIGKTVPVIANLAPRMMRGIESQGMILMADGGSGPSLLLPMRDVPPGSAVK